MAIDFCCPKCGSHMPVAGQLVGKSIRCRTCGAIGRVTGDAGATAPPAPSTADEAIVLSDADVAPLPHPPQPPVPAHPPGGFTMLDENPPELTADEADEHAAAMIAAPVSGEAPPAPTTSERILAAVEPLQGNLVWRLATNSWLWIGICIFAAGYLLSFIPVVLAVVAGVVIYIASLVLLAGLATCIYRMPRMPGSMRIGIFVVAGAAAAAWWGSHIAGACIAGVLGAVLVFHVLTNLSEVLRALRGWLQMTLLSAAVLGGCLLALSVVNVRLPFIAPDSHLDVAKLAAAAPAPQYREYEKQCWLGEVEIRDADTRRHVRIWSYLPLGVRGQRRSAPCVFIAARGASGITGSRLGYDQRAEHLAYAKAGFAVVAYDVEGELHDARGPTRDDMARAMASFMAADGGLIDAKLAIAYSADHIPEVDPGRLYAAGHGSAGTLALQLAAAEPRVRGCAVYAPLADLTSRYAGQKARLDALVSNAWSFVVGHSPVNIARQVNCPVWIYQCEDDNIAFVGDSERLVQRNPDHIGITTVPRGGHLDGYLKDGLFEGIAWLKRQDGRVASAPPSRPSPGIPRSTVAVAEPSSRPGTQPATRISAAAATRPAMPATEPARPVTQVAPQTRAAVPITQPAPASRPATTQQVPPLVPAVDPERAKLERAATNLIFLGADLRLEPAGGIGLLDLTGVTDAKIAAEQLGPLGRAAVIRISASQLTPEMVTAMASMKQIGRLDIDARAITDATLKQIGRLGNLEELSLAGATISDRDLAGLTGMSRLRKLSLRGTKIDDAGCDSLAKMTSLQILDLSQTAVTDAGVLKLKALKELVAMKLGQTAASPQAMQQLRQALPRLNIVPP